MVSFTFYESAAGAGHENREESQPMCIICNENKDEKLKPYISSTWDTIKRAAAKRLLLTSDCYKSTTTKVNMMQDKGSANYHSGCHKNYIAVKKPSEAVSKSPAKKPMIRCRSSMPPSDERGLLKGSCIFCPTLRKTVKGRIEPLSKCSVDVPCERLFATAPHSTNERLKAIISTLTDFTDLHSKEAQYHKSCWRAFHNKKENERAVKPPATTSGFSCRQQHFQTFAAISALIEEEILGKSQAMLSSSLLELYKTEFLDAGGMSMTAVEEILYTVLLCLKLMPEKVFKMMKKSISTNTHCCTAPSINN